MLNTIPRRSVNFTPTIFFNLLKSIIGGELEKGVYLDIFKKEFSEYIGVENVIGTYSARSGIYLLLKAFNFEEDDEIIMPAYNFHMLPIITKVLGLKPVFVDVNPRSYNIDTSLIERKVSSRTKAIVVVHMSGAPCEMDKIMEIAERNNLKVIEDCAQSLGAEYKGRKVGSFGDASIFSFDFNKNLPCFLGGAVTTNDGTICKNVKVLFKNYSREDWQNFWRNVVTNTVLYFIMNKNVFPFLTYPMIKILHIFRSNYLDTLTHSEIVMPDTIPAFYKLPLTNIQARIGVRQLNRLEKCNEKMRKNAHILNEELKGIKGLKIPTSSSENKHIYLYYRLIVDNVSVFRRKLLNRGVDSLQSCMINCASLKWFKNKGNFPVAMNVARNSLEIPNGPFLNDKEMKYIAKQIKEVNREIQDSE